VRLIHPRWPLYVNFRARGNRFMRAATLDRGRGTKRRQRPAPRLSYWAPPTPCNRAFAEARPIGVEFGSGLRPAFPGQFWPPASRWTSKRSGGKRLYRSCFLLAAGRAGPKLTVGYVQRRA